MAVNTTVHFRREGIYEGSGCSHLEVAIEALSGKSASGKYVFCASGCREMMPYRVEGGLDRIIVDIETEKAVEEVPYKIKMA